ncbi:MAG: hypothetical protein HZB53_05325 [Chloroflexi bacterium]|nr:hypothetical protein [Chloroflexota bacterium]
MNTVDAFTAVGQWLARPFGFALYRFVNGRIGRCRFDVRGGEHLRACGGAAFILAANHVQVPNTGAARCGPSPDTFILERLVRETTGQTMRTTPLNRIDDNTDMAWLRSPFARDVIDGTRKGLVLGLGHVPFQHGDPASVRAIFRAIEHDIIPGKRFLLIYPQGHWAPDLLPDEPLQDGAAFLAIQFQLPILPAFLRGCDTWELPARREPVVVAFGPPLIPPPKNKRTLHGDTATLMAALRASLMESRASMAT